MKKRAIALLLSAMLLTATACGGGGATDNQAPASEPTASESNAQENPSTEAPAESGGEEGKLQLWHIHTQETRTVPINNAIASFEAQNPGVEVEVTVLENDPYKTKLKTVMATGDAPDIFHSWGGGWLRSFVDEGLVYDMTDDIAGWKDQLNSAAVEMNTFNGKTWGSPYLVSSTPLYYNKDMFDRLGLSIPTTFTELEEVCDTLLENDIIPFALANQTKWPGAQHFVLLSMRLGGADIFQRAIDGEVSFEDEVFIKAGQMLQDMVTKGYFPEGANGINWDTGGSRMMFFSEQTAMIVQTSGMISTTKAENLDFYNEKFALANYPEVEGGVGKATDLLAGENAFSVSSNCSMKESAVKLVEFLSTDEDFQQEWANNGNFSPKVGIVAADPKVTEAMEQLNAATFLQNFIDQTMDPELAEKHKDTTQALYGFTMTPEEAAAEMQALYEEMYK